MLTSQASRTRVWCMERMNERKAKLKKLKDEWPKYQSAWRASEMTSRAITRIYYDHPCMLRINSDGTTVETSHGATFPVSDAIAVLRLIKIINKTGKGWKRNGEQVRLGPCRIDEIHPNGNITAGCHKVSHDEVMQFDTLLKDRNERTERTEPNQRRH